MVSRHAAGTALLAALALPAHAHSPIDGLNDFYAGALHPFASPAQLIALLALALAIGQQAHGVLQAAKAPLLTLAAALALGLATHRVIGDPLTDRALLVLAAGIGLAVAAQAALPRSAWAVLAAAVALAVGWGSGPGAADGAARALALAGTAAGVLLLVTYVAVMTSAARLPWLRIAVRVVGSWLAAAALLVLALSWAPLRAPAGA
jgi:hydrogenase/urease accessory protein HupE